MFDRLKQYYIEFIYNHQNNKFELLCSTVAIEVLSCMYESFILKDAIAPIELISEDDKKRYWEIAGKYQFERNKRIIASKAAYAIELINVN